MGDVSFAADERASWRLWRLPIAREAVICSGLAATVGPLIVWLAPRGGDLAAHEYQRTFFLVHGFTLSAARGTKTGSCTAASSPT